MDWRRPTAPGDGLRERRYASARQAPKSGWAASRGDEGARGVRGLCLANWTSLNAWWPWRWLHVTVSRSRPARHSCSPLLFDSSPGRRRTTNRTNTAHKYCFRPIGLRLTPCVGCGSTSQVVGGGSSVDDLHRADAQSWIGVVALDDVHDPRHLDFVAERRGLAMLLAQLFLVDRHEIVDVDRLLDKSRRP